MDTRELVTILDEEARRIKELSDSLSDHGDELDSSQKADIRAILSNRWLAAMFDEASFFFSKGNFDDFSRSLVQVKSTLESLL